MRSHANLIVALFTSIPVLWVGLQHSVSNFVCAKCRQLGNFIIAVSTAFVVGTIQQLALGSSIPYGPIYLLLVFVVRAASFALQLIIERWAGPTEYRHLACLANATLSQSTWEGSKAHFHELLSSASRLKSFNAAVLEQYISPRFSADKKNQLILQLEASFREKRDFQADRPFRKALASVKLKIKRNNRAFHGRQNKGTPSQALPRSRASSSRKG